MPSSGGEPEDGKRKAQGQHAEEGQAAVVVAPEVEADDGADEPGYHEADAYPGDDFV